MNKIFRRIAVVAFGLGAGSLVTGAVVGAGSPARAVSVVTVSAADFKPAAGLITFSEFAGGTINPTYTFSDYGGVSGQPTVNFGGFFLGQALSGNPAVDCPGGAPSGCVSGVPSGPLALDPSSPVTFITDDGANPTSPVLSGSPRFDGPIAVLFDRDLAGVGLDAGFFNAAGGTSIKVYDRLGALLGQTANVGTGIEFLGLVTNDGSEAIRGLEFSLIGPEPAGFAIDNLRFGRQGEVTPPDGNAVPGPLPLAGVGAALSMSRRLRRRLRRNQHG
jgi:hypothetical protein